MNITVHDADYVITTSGVLSHQDIHIRHGMIASITPAGPSPAPVGGPGESERSSGEGVRVIDGRGRAVMAGFKNAHTHAAMTLLRGYSDDMRLQPWLQERIWPAEAQLRAEDIYWGTRLAALEMIRSGTTFANDMYFHAPQVRRAFVDAGLRAAVGYAVFDFGDPQRREQLQEEVLEMCAPDKSCDESRDPADSRQSRVFFTISPHSIYTCSPELLQWSASLAVERDLILHTHMSETEQEVRDCLDACGVRPFERLEQLGILEQAGDRMIVAHGVWLNSRELDLVQRHGVTIAHNPASNMKLASGCFPWQEYARREVPLMLAPDGVASNNNLDMFDEMKLAALLQKHHHADPERLPAEEILAIATGARSSVFADAGVGGTIAPGEPADLILIDLDHPQIVPVHNLQSNLVYAANGSVTNTVICDGEVLMEDGTVPHEAEVIQESRRCAEELVRRVRS